MTPLDDFARAVAEGRDATEARLRERLRGPPPATPQELGYLAELLAARHFRGAAWSALPRSARRRIHGGDRGVALSDRGVDVVGVGAAGRPLLVQVKWYDDGGAIGHDPFARLVSVGTACRRGYALDGDPELRLLHQRGARVAQGVPNRCLVGVVALSAAELGLDGLAWGGPGPPERKDPAGEPPECEDPAGEPPEYEELAGEPAGGAGGARPAPDFAGFQAGPIARARELAAGGASLVRVQLPVGSGKSYVIAALAAGYRAAELPVVVLAPRAEIVRQLAALLTAAGWGRVYAVLDGARWPLGARGGEAVVASGQSVGPQLCRGDAPPFRAAALFVDEAHHHEGHDAAGRAIATPVRFDFSACLEGKADVAVAHRRAVELGLILAAEFVFAVFPRAPTPADLAAHLAAHPAHACVLACFQARERAIEFAALCRAAGVGAEPYVSGPGGGADRPERLEDFRAGRLRVLCVVGCVEMGVNVHRCDTVLLAEPWDSAARTLQLVGRGCRLHPTKARHFTVLCGAGPEDATERRVARLVETVHAECAAFCARTLSEADDCVDFVPGVGAGCAAGGAAAELAVPLLPAHLDALAAVRREVFDALGRRLAAEDPAAALALRYRRARERAAAAGLETFGAYAAWRAGLGPEARADLPEDPAAEFAALPPPGFGWADFLGWPDAPDLAAAVAAAVAEAAEAGLVTLADLGRPTAGLYGLLRRQTAAGAALPTNPLRPGETWAALFAGRG